MPSKESLKVPPGTIARRTFLLGAGTAAAAGFGSIVDAQQTGTPLERTKGSGLPLSFDDPVFDGVSTGNSAIKLTNGQSLVDTSIHLPANDLTVLCLGNNLLKRCRVKSREAVRIAGGGTFTIESCWFEAIGIGDDHADCIQCYSPGDVGILNIKNTTIRAYRNSDVTPPQIGSQGLFVADDWTGTVICENVVFWGAGNYACRIYPDTGGDIHIDFQNVFFVGPFQYGPYNIHGAGGHRIVVDRWDNVRNATIVGGALVAGPPIASPQENQQRHG
jgi:hypothetical protein